MASNTDTVPSERTATLDTGRSPSRPRRAALGWAGTIAACSAAAALAVATFTGGDNDVDSRTSQRAAQAEQYEREAHLEGQANTYGRDSGSTDPIETGNRAAQKAEAERYVEWLEGQAGSNSTDDDHDDDEFVPGSRHMPVQ